MPANKNVIILLTIAFAVLLAFAISKRSYYSEKHPILEDIRERFTILDPKYGKIPLKTGNKSYTENKSAITLCVADPATRKFYDMNTLMYVALHELSHVITKADGSKSHGEEFKRNFMRLLKEAHLKGIYDPNQPIPVSYCGATD